MKMHNPPHPSEVLKELCIEPLNLTGAAATLGVSRKIQYDLWQVEQAIGTIEVKRLSVF